MTLLSFESVQVLVDTSLGPTGLLAVSTIVFSACRCLFLRSVMLCWSWWFRYALAVMSKLCTIFVPFTLVFVITGTVGETNLATPTASLFVGHVSGFHEMKLLSFVWVDS